MPGGRTILGGVLVLIFLIGARIVGTIVGAVIGGRLLMLAAWYAMARKYVAVNVA